MNNTNIYQPNLLPEVTESRIDLETFLAYREDFLRTQASKTKIDTTEVVYENGIVFTPEFAVSR